MSFQTDGLGDLGLFLRSGGWSFGGSHITGMRIEKRKDVGVFLSAFGCHPKLQVVWENGWFSTSGANVAKMYHPSCYLEHIRRHPHFFLKDMEVLIFGFWCCVVSEEEEATVVFFCLRGVFFLMEVEVGTIDYVRSQKLLRETLYSSLFLFLSDSWSWD